MSKQLTLCDATTDFISRGNQWWRRKMLAFFAGYSAARIRKIITHSYFILTYITGERIENKQVLVNKSMPVVTSSGLQPGNVAFTIYLWFPHVILRPCELFLHIILTLYVNENNHLMASLAHNSTEFHQALPKFEMFDANSCIWQNSKLQRHIWVCNQKFVVLNEVSFYKRKKKEKKKGTFQKPFL